MGDPVPGAELYIEHEPNDEPIAHGETDERGDWTVTLDKGRYSLSVGLGLERTRTVAAIDVQLDAPGFHRSKAYAVDHRMGRRASMSMPFTLSRKTELRLHVEQLRALDPLERALRAGLARHELQLGDGSKWIEALIEAIGAHLGAPAAVGPETTEQTWPLPPRQTVVATFTMDAPDGLLLIRVHVQGWMDAGRCMVGVGTSAVDVYGQIPDLATTVVDSICNALSELSAPPSGIELILIDRTEAIGSKGGFAVGGFSSQ